MYINYDLIRLFNTDNPVSASFNPRLGRVYDDKDFYADVRCIGELKSMISDCCSAGHDVILSSAYRSLERQAELFEHDVREYMLKGLSRDVAEGEAARSIAIPGTSEHHSGLAFDIISRDFTDFEKEAVLTPDKQWLFSHCHEYGFIPRYPEGSQHITGISFEPWHFRYVGKKAAEEMAKLGFCLEEYLIHCTERINGLFSFVVHDRERDAWHFACDRFGGKPLYYSFADRKPVFSDSINRLIDRHDLPKSFREDLLEVYLSYSYVPGEDTLMEGIRKALPGYLYEYHDGRLTKNRYFTPTYNIDRSKTLNQWAAEVEKILDDICSSEEEGITSLLSSGVDSNYLCTRLKARKTHTACYAEKSASESAEAQKCACRIGSEHNNVLITPTMFFDFADDAMEALGQPTGDATMPVLIALGDEISKDSKVCYSGEGIDELFMGYYYRDMNDISPDVPLEKAEYLGCTQAFDEEEKKRILKNYNGTKKMLYTREAYELGCGESRLNQAALVDMLVWMNGNLLPAVHAAGAYNDIQVKLPYLDNRLYDLCLKIPEEYKYSNTMTKLVFRKAVEKTVGKQISLTPKRGFPVPITSWLKMPKYAEKVKRAFSSETAQRYFHTDRLLEMHEEFLADDKGELSWRPIWCIYCFIIWYERMFGDDTKVPHWKLNDPRFNMAAAWPEEEYPDADYRWFYQAGCLVTSLATMLRYYGLETEKNQSLFNPWVLNSKLKEINAFDSSADLVISSISELYSVEFLGTEPYSAERLQTLHSEGKMCIIKVNGKHDDIHFVFPVSVGNGDVEIIDSGSEKNKLSMFDHVFEIYVFKRS